MFLCDYSRDWVLEIGIPLEPKHRFDNFDAAKLDSKIKTVYQDIRGRNLL